MIANRDETGELGFDETKNQVYRFLCREGRHRVVLVDCGCWEGCWRASKGFCTEMLSERHYGRISGMPRAFILFSWNFNTPE